jgi:hypothetical protein
VNSHGGFENPVSGREVAIYIVNYSECILGHEAGWDKECKKNESFFHNRVVLSDFKFFE